MTYKIPNLLEKGVIYMEPIKYFICVLPETVTIRKTCGDKPVRMKAEEYLDIARAASKHAFRSPNKWGRKCGKKAREQ